MVDHDCVLSQKADVNVETAAEEEAKVPELDQAIAAFIATSILERLTMTRKNRKVLYT